RLARSKDELAVYGLDNSRGDTKAALIAHRFGGIDDKVQQDLLEASARSGDRWYITVQLQGKCHAAEKRFAQQKHHFFDQFDYGIGGALLRPFPAVAQHGAHDFLAL